jgi:hypothetical protein
MRKDKIFQLIGKLTIQFATMEHRLQGLLEILMGDGNILVGPLFIHNMNMVALLRKISIVSRCRIQDNTLLLTELERTIKKIDDLREERNLLIHGDWKIESTSSSPVTVRDFKMSYNGGIWQEFTETSFNEKKLTHLINRLNGLGNEVDYLVRKLNEQQAASNSIND